MNARTDRDLLVAARSDPQAFEELYRRRVGATVRFATRRSRRPEEVVDLVAAIWLEVIASLERYDPNRGDALPWILGIGAKLCAAERRRRSRELEALHRLGGRRTLDDDDFARLEREIDAAAVAPRLRASLASLPPSERAIAELVLLDEMTPAKAGKALGIGPAAVRMRLSRARRKLRRVAPKPDEEAFLSVEPITEVSP